MLWFEFGGALRFGGTMEIAGLNQEINPVRVQGIIKSVPRYYLDFTSKDFEGIQPWRGLRGRCDGEATSRRSFSFI